MSDLDLTLYRVEVTTISGGANGPCLRAEWCKLGEPLRSICDEMMREHQADSARWPVPAAFAAARPGELRTACTSIAALKDWFGDWLPILLSAGARITVVRVPEDLIVERDPRQVTYRMPA